MSDFKDVPNSVVEAVLAFVNASGIEEMKRLLRSRKGDLLTDEADTTLGRLK